MYSQNNEEQIIQDYFNGRAARFLDIGAFDGKSLSNTFRLLETGWSGVLVEPTPQNFIELMNNTRSFSKNTVLLLAAVGGVESIMQLFIDESPDRKWATTVNQKYMESGSVMAASPVIVQLPVVSIERLYQTYGKFEFISLDAEWEDFSILKAMPKDMLAACELLCIEPMCIPEREAMKLWLSEAKFKTYAETPENLIVCKQ